MALVRGSTGQVVARYSYDAWGKCTVTNASGYTVGTKNPFRYRGYYYDAETGLYYLNSRYYNPEWGRFISPDVFVSTGQGLTGANMFAYCGNNPVNCADPSGRLAAWLIGGAIGGLVGGISAAVRGENILAGAARGATSGAIAGAAVDIALATVATGGAVAVAGAGVIAFAGGYTGNIAGEQTRSLISSGSFVKIDEGMRARSFMAGALNVFSLCVSTHLKYVDEGWTGFNKSRELQDMIQTVKRNILNYSISPIDISSTSATLNIAVLGSIILSGE